MARHVDLVEENVKYIDFKDDVKEDEEYIEELGSETEEAKKEDKEKIAKEAKQKNDEPARKKSNRNRKSSERYVNPYIHVNYSVANILSMFQEVIEVKSSRRQL